MKKKIMILKNRFTNNYVLLEIGFPNSQTQNMYNLDEMRYFYWGEIETNRDEILKAPSMIENGTLTISKELLMTLLSDFKDVRFLNVA